MRAVGTTNFGRAVAAVTSSPFGVGPGRFHYATEATDVETVYLGTFDRRIVDEVGGYDETRLQWAAEDQELAYRLRLAGRRIRLDPTIRSWYFPRQTPRALWRQYENYGMCKASTLAKHRTLPYWRPLAPALMVAASVGWAVGGAGPAPSGGGRPAGRGLRRRPPGRSACASRDEPGVAPHRAVATLAICHWGYGLGFWRGIGRIVRRRPFDVRAAGPAMSPLPSPDRLSEYAVKGAHLGLRQVAQAPEQRVARRLAPPGRARPDPGAGRRRG